MEGRLETASNGHGKRAQPYNKQTTRVLFDRGYFLLGGGNHRQALDHPLKRDYAQTGEGQKGAQPGQ